MEDAMALDEMDYGMILKTGKFMKNKQAKIVDEQIPDKLSKIREYKSKIYSDNIDDVSSNIDKLFSNGFKYTLMPGKTPSGQDVSEYFFDREQKRILCSFCYNCNINVQNVWNPSKICGRIRNPIECI